MTAGEGREGMTTFDRIILVAIFAMMVSNTYCIHQIMGAMGMKP
jgi:hypothetical protein